MNFQDKINSKSKTKHYLCHKKSDTMASQEEVALFLKQFHQKLAIYNIVFRDDRGKNLSTLALLDIPAAARIKVIKEITTEDYSEGPISDTLNQINEMWVFGKEIRKHEIYIKISLGYPNCSTICISFHVAEHPMNYPYKQETKTKDRKGGKI